MSGLQSTLEVVTTLATAGAAGFAAWAAWIARGSAEATRAGVEEARMARQASITPRLVMSRDFLDFQFQWPHPETLNGEPVFRARRHWKDKDPIPPTFSLANYGQSPALEVEVIFDLEDPNGEISLPDQIKDLGIGIPARPDGTPSRSLTFQLPTGSIGLGMYRRATVYVAHCPPNESVTIGFPEALLTTLFMRALQTGTPSKAPSPIRMRTTINAHTIEGANYSTEFLFEMEPFWTGSTHPVTVAGRFEEVPVFPKGDYLRSALS